jgi:recombination protein RecA
MARIKKSETPTSTNDVDAPTVEASRLKAIAKATNGINDKYGEMSAFFLGSNPRVEVKRVSTGSLALDYVIGGGVANGRIHEFFGPEGSGKTSAALQTVGNVQKEGGVAVYVDVEHAMDPKQAHRLGVDINKLIFSQPNSAEQALNIMATYIKAGVDIIVLDSIASLVPQAVMDGEAEDQTVALVARLMSKSLSKIATLAGESGTKVIFINQVRAAIGGYGNPETTTGGKALPFYSSIRVRISKGQQIKKKVRGEERPIGQKVFFRCKKNKVSTPFLNAESEFYWKDGYNTPYDIVTFGKKYGVFNSTCSKDLTENPEGEQIMWNGQKVTKTDMLADAIRDKSSGLEEKYYPIVLKRMLEDQNFDDDDDDDATKDENEEASQDVAISEDAIEDVVD